MEQILLFLKPMIEAYAGNYGIALQIVAIVGSLRVAIKPIMSAFLAVTKATTWTQKDDELYNKINGSKAYTTFLFVLDWIASIKIKPQKK